MSIKIDAITIEQDENGRYRLNDLHKAAGGENRYRPSLWSQNQQAQELIAHLDGNAGNGMFKSKAGIPALKVTHGSNTQGTYACRELVYAYAMWISPVFSMKVIQTFDAAVMAQHKMMNSSNPDVFMVSTSEWINATQRMTGDEEIKRCKLVIDIEREIALGVRSPYEIPAFLRRGADDVGSLAEHQIAVLRSALLETKPIWAKIRRYHQAGLTQKEMLRLLDIGDSALRQYLRHMALCGLIDYQPNKASSAGGKALQAKKLAVQNVH